MGDASNAAIWSGADVYVGPDGTAGPVDITAAWPVAYSAAGLLDGDEGFTEARSDDSNEFYAWGGILVKRTKSKHKREITFACLEDNAVTFGLVNPGSTRTTTTGVTTKVIKVPSTSTFAIGFETRDGAKVKRRWCKKAEVSKIDDVKDGESDLTVYKVTVVLYPENDGTLYHEVEG